MPLRLMTLAPNGRRSSSLRKVAVDLRKVAVDRHGTCL